MAWRTATENEYEDLWLVTGIQHGFPNLVATLSPGIGGSNKRSRDIKRSFDTNIHSWLKGPPSVEYVIYDGQYLRQCRVAEGEIVEVNHV